MGFFARSVAPFSVLRVRRLRTKLAMLVLLPLVVAIGFSAGRVVEERRTVVELEQRAERVVVVRSLVDLQTALALEGTFTLAVQESARIGLGPFVEGFAEQLAEATATRAAVTDSLAANAAIVDELTEPGFHQRIAGALEQIDAEQALLIEAVSVGAGNFNGQQEVVDLVYLLASQGGRVRDGIARISASSDPSTRVEVALLSELAEMQVAALEEGVLLLQGVVAPDTGLRGTQVADGLAAGARHDRALDALAVSLPTELAARAAVQRGSQLERAWQDFRNATRQLAGFEPGPGEFDLLEVAAVGEERISFAGDLRDAYGEFVATQVAQAIVAAQEERTDATVATIGVLLATVLIVSFFGHRMHRRIGLLHDRAAAFASGDIDLPPLEVGGHDEIADLGGTLDEMAETLRVVTAQATALADGRPAPDHAAPGVIGEQLQRSVTTMAELTDRLRASEEMSRSLIETSAEAIWTVDAAGTVVSANRGAHELFAVADGALVGEAASSIVPDDPVFSTADVGQTDVPVLIAHPDGERSILVTTRQIDLGVGMLTAFFARDVTEMRRMQEQLQWEATHDHLTGLVNRAGMVMALERAAAQGRRRREGFGLIYLDLDRFKVVNDTSGHAAGDEVLVEAGRRIRESCRPGDLVARNGGDEFVVLVDGVRDIGGVVALAERLQASFDRPVTVDDRELRVSASIGVAWFDPFSDRAMEHLRNADAAMYQAKSTGPGQIRVFDEDMRAWVLERAEIDRELSLAVSRRELDAHFQPVIGPDDGVTGVELLCRWTTRDGRSIPPDTFIRVAEESTLIIDIGIDMLGRAAALLEEWSHDPERRHLSVAVNISGRHVAHSAIVEHVSDVVAAGTFAPHLLVLEITETSLLGDLAPVIDVLESIRALGVRVSIDDFGVGHASISYLRELPVDIVKVDRSIVQRFGEGGADGAIIEMLVNLSGVLELVLVAEGVETRDQLQRLRAAGCTHSQGWHHARAMPKEQLEQWLRQRADRGPIALSKAEPHPEP